MSHHDDGGGVPAIGSLTFPIFTKVSHDLLPMSPIIVIGDVSLLAAEPWSFLLAADLQFSVIPRLKVKQ